MEGHFAVHYIEKFYRHIIYHLGNPQEVFWKDVEGQAKKRDFKFLRKRTDGSKNCFCWIWSITNNLDSVDTANYFGDIICHAKNWLTWVIILSIKTGELSAGKFAFLKNMANTILNMVI